MRTLVKVAINAAAIWVAAALLEGMTLADGFTTNSTKLVTAPVPSTAPTGGVVGACGAAGCVKAFVIVTEPTSAAVTRARTLNMIETPAT